MKNKNILFIVEGEEDEPNFFECVNGICHPQYQLKFYVYNTSIHDLIHAFFQDNEFDPDLDIIATLYSYEKDIDKKELLLRKYTDIFLVFDMEPHYQKTYFNQIQKMIEHFQNSEEEGKLFINYPMMQAYKHIGMMPDDGFKERKVSMIEVMDYKKIVNEEGKYLDLRRYNYTVLMSVCAHHLMKINYILTGEYRIPDLEQFLTFDYSELFHKECKMVEQQRFVDVVNTSIMWILEYSPKSFLNELTVHRDKFLF